MTSRRGATVLLVATALVLGACGHLGLGGGEQEAPPPTATPAPPPIESDVYARAETARVEFYEREVERLRADLRQAEESLIAMESGLRGFQSRADAVSALAEARIALERVGPRVPWRQDQVSEARDKLAEAGHQIEEGHVGSAVFFASRAHRITESLRVEAAQVEAWADKRIVLGKMVNLRAGPSTRYRVVDVLVAATPVFPERHSGNWTLVRTPEGRVGWVYASLLTAP
jgi:hypothetical protein